MSKDSIENSLTDAALAGAANALRPVVSLLLDAGVGATETAHLIRWLFVHEAASRSRSRGQRVSVSGTAAITGLPRSVVRDHLAHPVALGLPPRHGAPHKANRVLLAWHSDPGFLLGDGTARPLPYSGSDPSFVQLAHKYAADIPARALLNELLDTNAVIETPERLLKPMKMETSRIGPEADRLRSIGEAMGAVWHAISKEARPNSPSESAFRRIISDPISARSSNRVRRDLRRRLEAFTLATNQYLLDQSRDEDTVAGGLPRPITFEIFVCLDESEVLCTVEAKELGNTPE